MIGTKENMTVLNRNGIMTDMIVAIRMNIMSVAMTGTKENSIVMIDNEIRKGIKTTPLTELLIAI